MPTQLPYLDTFVKAAEMSNFSRAAGVLGITQAAVSQRIHALERELRTALFHRRGGRVELTDAGRKLYDYAQRIEAMHEEIREHFGRYKPRVTGELVLAASTVPGEYLLPKLLAAFRRKQPDVRVRVMIADSQSVLELVEGGKVHLGFTGKKPAGATFEFQPFAEDELVLAVPPRHPWSRRQRIRWNMVAAKPLIVREAGSGSRHFFEQALSRSAANMREPKIAMELGSNEAIKEAVRSGLGIAILSSHAVQKERRAGRLRVLHIQGLDLKRTLYLVRDRRRVLTLPERLLLDFIHSPRAPRP